MEHTEHEREPLDALEVSVLDGHDAGVGEQLLRIVVDELSVDEHVAAVLFDLLHLFAHLLLLGELELGDLLSGEPQNTSRSLADAEEKR